MGYCCGGKPVSPIVLKCVIPMCIYIVNKLRLVDWILMVTNYRICDSCSVFDLLPPRKLLIFLFNKIHIITNWQ